MGETWVATYKEGDVMNETQLTNHENLFGMFFPRAQLTMLEQEFGGKLVRNSYLQAILLAGLSKHLKGRGALPDFVKVSGSESKFKPVNVNVDIYGTEIRNIGTNYFVFIEIRRVYVLDPKKNRYL